MSAITELGYEKPSPIQAEALPILLGSPTDFLGLAATGTGKTAAFSIPLLERIDPSKRSVQALILCPTRELAVQVSGQINLLGKYKGIKSFPIYGGAGYGDQIAAIKRGVSVIVGTPGRLVDHLEKGTLRLDELEVLVLDEADEMISMGFKDDLEAILEQTPQGDEVADSSCNVWLFSATMSPEVRRVADKYLREPQQVQINRKEMLSGTVEQLYYITQESNKPEVLCKLLDAAEDFYGLIFCQTKLLVTDLVRYMADRGYKVDCLHGDMDQKAREKTMQAFRDRKVTLLICTDVASRGLDVKDITHVINYSLPRELDNYVHRIGRTGRSGKTGIAMSLVTQSHRGLIGRIEKMTKSRMKEGKVPTRKEIASKKVAHHLTKFQADTTYPRALETMNLQWKEAVAQMSAEEVAARFLALSYPELFGDREKTAPVNGAYVGRAKPAMTFKPNPDLRILKVETAPATGVVLPSKGAERGNESSRPAAAPFSSPAPAPTPTVIASVAKTPKRELALSPKDFDEADFYGAPKASKKFDKKKKKSESRNNETQKDFQSKPFKKKSGFWDRPLSKGADKTPGSGPRK